MFKRCKLNNIKHSHAYSHKGYFEIEFSDSWSHSWWWLNALKVWNLISIPFWSILPRFNIRNNVLKACLDSSKWWTTLETTCCMRLRFRKVLFRKGHIRKIHIKMVHLKNEHFLSSEFTFRMMLWRLEVSLTFWNVMEKTHNDYIYILGYRTNGSFLKMSYS